MTTPRYLVSMETTAARLAEERDGVLALLATADTVGSWLWLPGTNTWTCSPRMRRLYGLAAGSRPQTFESYRARLHPDDRFAVTAALAAAVRDGGDFAYDERVLQADGSLRVLRTNGVVLRGGEGDPLRVVGMCVDLTERNALEQALTARNAALAIANEELRLQNEALARQAEELARQADALQALDRGKDEFLSVLSHELRTPLNFIMGFANILEEELQGPLNDDQHASVTKVLRGGELLTRLVEDLLDVARIQTGKPLVVVRDSDYAALVQDVVACFAVRAEEAQVRLMADVSPVSNTQLDPERVAQALGNLIGNALKFTPPGGRVLVRVFEIGGALVTEVSDTGPGLPPGFTDRAFEKFAQLDMSTTRRAGGIGLGLAIARGLIEAHGGTIGVAGEAVGGATFWFTLPVRT